MDRNADSFLAFPGVITSLSARRAWIEICYLDNIEIIEAVALRKESVDRNKYVVQCRKVMNGRSPQGERG